MSVDIIKNCVVSEDGAMYCWDADKRCYYRLNKKVIPIDQLPMDALRGLLSLAHKEEIDK